MKKLLIIKDNSLKPEWKRGENRVREGWGKDEFEVIPRPIRGLFAIKNFWFLMIWLIQGENRVRMGVEIGEASVSFWSIRGHSKVIPRSITPQKSLF